ncbi:MAG: CPBP family intramembrane metalloprotease [Fimbriimonadales bacterium]|nr:CPBP family intramembrane metalloprotease [Fimbriimonadales bacterium]
MFPSRPRPSAETAFVAVLGLLALAAYLGVYWPFREGSAATPAQVLGMVPLLALAVGFALPMGSEQAVEAWRRAIRARPGLVWLCPSSLSLAYLFGAAAAGRSLSEALGLAVYLHAPVALAVAAGRASERSWAARAADWAFVLAAWLPIQLRWIDLPTIPLPEGRDQVKLDTLLAAAVAFWSILVARRLEGFQFRLFFTRGDLHLGLKVFAAYALVALPLALATGFVRTGWAFTLHETEFQQPAWLVYPLLPVGMYFGVALIEEALFRGLLQNLLARTLGSPWVALALASAAFGAVHHKFGQPGLYVLFSSLAGAFYGYAYLRTGRIMPGAVAHALVNSVWLALFNPMASR